MPQSSYFCKGNGYTCRGGNSVHFLSTFVNRVLFAKLLPGSTFVCWPTSKVTRFEKANWNSQKAKLAQKSFKCIHSLYKVVRIDTEIVDKNWHFKCHYFYKRLSLLALVSEYFLVIKVLELTNQDLCYRNDQHDYLAGSCS